MSTLSMIAACWTKVVKAYTEPEKPKWGVIPDRPPRPKTLDEALAQLLEVDRQWRTEFITYPRSQVSEVLHDRREDALENLFAIIAPDHLRGPLFGYPKDVLEKWFAEIAPGDARRPDDVRGHRHHASIEPPR